MKFLTLVTLLALSLSAPADDKKMVKSVIKSLDKVNAKDEALCAPEKNLKEDAESKLIAEKKWFEGAKDCSKKEARTPAYEVLQVNAGYYIMRQNKCINFEAPFIYLYIGDEGALLIDTGATASASQMPLRKWVDDVLKSHPKGDKLKLVVAHSHSHGDHMAGDEQFAGRPNTTVVGSSPSAVAKAFNIQNWPNGEGTLDLGGRKMSILPIPGHERSSIAVYDHKSGDMVTGDTMYPGNIFLSESNWGEFKTSVNRMHAFSQKNKVRNYLGAHIEMSAEPGKDFEYGSTYHPNEHNLPLRQEHLNELKKYVDENPRPAYKKFADFIINI